MMKRKRLAGELFSGREREELSPICQSCNVFVAHSTATTTTTAVKGCLYLKITSSFSPPLLLSVKYTQTARTHTHTHARTHARTHTHTHTHTQRKRDRHMHTHTHTHTHAH